jgi:hypothetical protein
MKKTILKKMVLLAGLVLLGFTSYGQDEEDTSWNHWYPDSTYVSEPQPTIVENTLNAVVRLETKAIVRLKFKQLTDEINIAVYDNESFTYHEDYQRSGEYVQFVSLPLDKSFSVVQYLSDGTSMVVANIDTRNKKSQPIEVSDALAKSLENWVIIETSEQPRALTHISNDVSLDYIERLYYIQRFYDADQHFGDDLVGTDPPVWGDDLPIDTHVDPNDIPDFIEYNEEEEEDDEEDCKCNYVLSLTRWISPGIPDKPNRLHHYNYINHSKWYYGKGSNIFSHLEEWNNGPAKQHFLVTENTKVKGPHREATKGNLIDNTSASNNESELYWHLVCDKTASGKAVPEKCLCEKELTISYQYDTRLIANAQSINCGLLCGDKGAAATAEDWASVILTRHKLNDEIEVLETSRAIVKASCEDVGPLNTVAQYADFAAKMAEALVPVAGKITLTKDKGVWVVKPEFTIDLDVAEQIKNLAIAIESGTKIFQTPDGTCTIIDKKPTLFKRTRVITLKANEPLTLTMYSAHQLSAGAKRSGRGEAKVISGYYMSGTLTTNKTQTELDYCCMKKIGTYNSGASADSPEPIQTYQDFMGYEFGKVGPWDAPYNTQNPRTWNSSDIDVPFQVDYLKGNSGCDDVIFKTKVAPEESEYLQSFEARFDGNANLVIQGNTELEEISYVVYDIAGRTIAQGITIEPILSLSSAGISGLSMGTYIITLHEVKSNKLPRTIKINKL